MTIKTRRRISVKDDFDKLLEKYLEDAEFKAEYEALELEYKNIQAMIESRKQCYTSQKELDIRKKDGT